MEKSLVSLNQSLWNEVNSILNSNQVTKQQFLNKALEQLQNIVDLQNEIELENNVSDHNHRSNLFISGPPRPQLLRQPDARSSVGRRLRKHVVQLQEVLDAVSVGGSHQDEAAELVRDCGKDGKVGS